LVEIRRRVGLGFQYPEHQLFEETVFQEISFVLRQQKTLSPEEIDRRVRSACSWVGLEGEKFFHRSPFELSGGEMRRVALAGVLVQDPHLLILDEPTVGLDGAGRREILREIQEVHRSGKTVIVVSHDLDDLIGLVDRLIVLEKGRLLLTGRPTEVFSLLLQSDRLHFLVPSIFQLCHSLRAQGWDLPDNIFRMEDALSAIDQFLKKNHSPCAGVH